MKKEFRIVWTKNTNVRYFIGYGLRGVTVWSDDINNAFTYDTQESADFGHRQIKSLMIVNEKKDVNDIDAFLSIEATGDNPTTHNPNKAYKKAMDII